MTTLSLFSHCVVTVPSRWLVWNRNSAVYQFQKFWKTFNKLIYIFTNIILHGYISSPNRHNDVSDKKNKSWYIVMSICRRYLRHLERSFDCITFIWPKVWVWLNVYMWPANHKMSEKLSVSLQRYAHFIIVGQFYLILSINPEKVIKIKLKVVTKLETPGVGVTQIWNSYSCSFMKPQNAP